MADPIPPVLALMPVAPLLLPQPPAPLALQQEEFATCTTAVVIMTPAQLNRLLNNGISTAEDMAMLDNETLMAIMPDATTSAMIKMRLKTLKSWIDREFNTVVGQPSGTLDIRRFTPEVCRDLQRTLSRKGSSTVSFKSSTQSDVKDGIGTFNGKISNWKRSKRKFEAGLAQLKNENGIPLSYITRDDGEREAAVAAGGFAAQLYEAPM